MRFLGTSMLHLVLRARALTLKHRTFRTLISHGFAPTGKEYLTSGITGEPIESYIFCTSAVRSYCLTPTASTVSA